MRNSLRWSNILCIFVYLEKREWNVLIRQVCKVIFYYTKDWEFLRVKPIVFTYVFVLWLCVFMWVHTCACPCVWRAELCLRCLPWLFSTLVWKYYFWLSSPLRLAWMVNELPGLHGSSFAVPEVQKCTIVLLFLGEGARNLLIWAHSPMIVWQVFYLPSPISDIHIKWFPGLFSPLWKRICHCNRNYHSFLYSHSESLVERTVPDTE